MGVIRQLEFPAGGLDLGVGYQKQPPYSTPRAINVRTRESLMGRSRGGSRPMLSKYNSTQLGIAAYRKINMIATANTAEIASEQSWSWDWADGYADWDYNSGGGGGAFRYDVSGFCYNASSISTAAEATHTLPADLSASQPFTIATTLEASPYPLGGASALGYGLDDHANWSAPTGKTYAYMLISRTSAVESTLNIKTYKIESGSETELSDDSYTVANDGTAEIAVSMVVDGMDVSFYYGATLLATTTVAGSFSGSLVGLYLDAQKTQVWQTNSPTLIGFGQLDISYYVSAYSQSTTKSVFAAGGNLYIQDNETDTPTAISDLAANYYNVSPLHPIRAVEMFGKLYIADYSTPRASGTNGAVSGASHNKFDSASYADWTAVGSSAADTAIIPNSDVLEIVDDTHGGTYLITAVAAGELTFSPALASNPTGLTFKIVRSPKILDLATETLSVWKTTDIATYGSVPCGCPLIARFGGRIYLAGESENPHVWYACRMGEPLDWDYSAAADDLSGAIAGTTAFEGVIADALTGLCPINDDIMVMTTINETWKMVGNLRDGGAILNLSTETGMIAADGWAILPNGVLLLLGLYGIYIVDPTAGSFQKYAAEPFSRRQLPAELQNISNANFWISMIWDGSTETIHLYLTPRGGLAGTHLIMEWPSRAFIEATLPSDMQPCCIGQSCAGTLLLGGMDGYLRKYDPDALTDDGTTMTSEVIIGPFMLAPGLQQGTLDRIATIFADGSADVSWALRVSDSAEGAVNESDAETGTWTEGPNADERPGVVGSSACLVLSSTGRWAMESIEIETAATGDRRLL